MLDDVAVVAHGVSSSSRILPFLRSLPSLVQLIVVDTSPYPNLQPATCRPQRTTMLHYRGSPAKALQVGAMVARKPWLLFADMTTVFCDQYFHLLQDYHENDILFGPLLPSPGNPPRIGGRSKLSPLRRLAVPVAYDANLFVRSAAFFAIGGFKTSLTEGYGAEFVERARESGYPATFRRDLIIFWEADRDVQDSSGVEIIPISAAVRQGEAAVLTHRN